MKMQKCLVSKQDSRNEKREDIFLLQGKNKKINVKKER